jgi:hypothetical protein
VAAISRLVPDLGDDLVVAMVRMQQIFASLNYNSIPLPPPLAGDVAAAAARRVELALAATQTRTHWPPPPGGAFISPAGRQLLCLRQLVLDDGDLRVLACAAQVLGYELAANPAGPLAVKVAVAAEELWPIDDASPSLSFVATLARLLGLLDLSDSVADVQVINERIADAGKQPVVLDPAGYRAYRRLRAHMELFWPTEDQP